MKKIVSLLMVVLVLATLACSAAFAEEWPTKAITLICGYSAGGSSDLGCRYLATALEKILGVPVIVENQPGSSSWLAWNTLLNTAKPDGYTFALVNHGVMFGHYDATNPREQTMDDFELLCNHVVDYQCLCIRLDETRYSDYASMIEYAKTNPLIIASASNTINSGDATVAKMLEQRHGCQFVVIPVDGASDATTMFLAGETDVLSCNVGDVGEAEENGYKPIVVFGQERSKYLPDVPTSTELGLDTYVSASVRGYAYMPGVDPEIVAKMQDALVKAFDDEEYQASMAAMGAETKLYVGEDYTNLLLGMLDERLELWGVEK